MKPRNHAHWAPRRPKYIPEPEDTLATYLTSGAVLFFFVVAFGLLLWALS